MAINNYEGTVALSLFEAKQFRDMLNAAIDKVDSNVYSGSSKEDMHE